MLMVEQSAEMALAGPSGRWRTGSVVVTGLAELRSDERVTSYLGVAL
jgi:hypothetical protein